ncbi:hypothetical protein O6495_24270, partial [Salmonella enterica subsp. enterica]
DKAAGDAFLTGEGSRCRSNDDSSATAFISQVVSADLPEAERRLLVTGRLSLLGACTWEGASLGDPEHIQSAAGRELRTYLQAAGDFYSGRF